MSSDDEIPQNPNVHFRTLGSLWVVYGVIRVIAAIMLLIFGPTATLMFGALLSRVPDPFALMDIFHAVYTILIVLSAVCGVLGVIAGLALLGRMRSGRMLALIASILSLCDTPLGLTLGIYTLVELLPIKSSKVYGQFGQAAQVARV